MPLVRDVVECGATSLAGAMASSLVPERTRIGCESVLNTVAGGSPVNVEAFRVLLELPGSLSLIGDENIAELTLRGSILLDPLQPVGSQYFRQTLLAA